MNHKSHIHSGTALALALGIAASTAHAAASAPTESIEHLKELGSKLDAGTLSPAEAQELLRALTHQAISAGETTPTVQAAPTTPGTGDKVIAVYFDRNTTKLVIEARHPFVAGNPVFVGPTEIEAVLQDLLSRSQGLYYYAASIPEHVTVNKNDLVVTQKARVMEAASALQLKISETYTFESKRRGEVTAVQDGRAMIDRGTLHEVRERDIYRVLDASGARKGFIEIRGIGDLQSSGVLYNRVEDRNKLALQTAPGDRVVFMGQRKLFSLGAFTGIRVNKNEEFGGTERGNARGLIWNLMFRNGWGFEAVFGEITRSIAGSGLDQIPRPFGVVGEYRQRIDETASYSFPVAIKKNFLFPSIASPFVLAGAAYYRAGIDYSKTANDPSGGKMYTNSWSASTRGIAPMLGAGVELFPARLIRLRVDVRRFTGPTIHANDKTLSAEQTFVSFGIFSGW